MFLKRFPLALSCLALVPMFWGGSAARADVTSGTASAFGVEANVGLSATVLGVGVNATLSAGPTPTVSGSAPPPFNNSNSLASVAASASISAVGVGSLSTGILNVNAQSNATGTGAATTSASASVANLSTSLALDALLGLGTTLVTLGATVVQSTAQVTGDIGALVPSGTTTIVGGSFFLGVANLSATVFASVNPAPNTTITINDAVLVGLGFVAGSVAGSITIILNEQIVTGNGNTSSGITVNAIDITFNQFAGGVILGLPAGITLNGQIIVSQSRAGQTAQAPGGGGGGAQPVPEPSSLAMLGLIGVAGAIRRYRQRKFAV